MIPAGDQAMTDEALTEAGLAEKLAPGSVEFERFVDVTARRPSGEGSVQHYRNPEEHARSFELALKGLQVQPDDVYLELGFGGGQLLRMVLATAARAAGIDHSPEMVTLAAELNHEAITAGRLELVHGQVGHLPWAEGDFSCAAAVNMWFFVPHPEQTLREVARVLRRGGRFVIVTVAPGSDDRSAGPWAPALRTYDPETMERMVLDAGFSAVEMQAPDPGTQVVRATK